MSRNAGNWRIAPLNSVPTDPMVLCRAAHAVASVNNDIDSGMAFVDRALKVNPSLPLAWYVSGWLNYARVNPEWRPSIWSER